MGCGWDGVRWGEMGQGLSRRSEKANDCLYCGFPGESGSRTLQNHPHMAFSLSPRAALPRHSKAELCQNLLRGVRAVLRLIFPAGNSPLRCSARAPSFFVVPSPSPGPRGAPRALPCSSKNLASWSSRRRMWVCLVAGWLCQGHGE